MSIPAEAKTIREAVVRPATSGDRGQLREMYEDFEPRPASLGLPPPAGIDQWLDRLCGALNFVAAVDNNLIGHAVLCPGGDSGEVAVFVRQEFRVSGIGRRLLDALIEEARKLGLGSVWGITELDNLPMLRLAHAAGFVRDEKDPTRFRMVLLPKRGEAAGAIENAGRDSG